METAKLKKFAQFARRSLLEQVSAKLKLVLAENSAARRERAEAIKKLEEAIKGHGKEQVIERVAYIWFNRFCALRFMDVNRYTRIGVVSPSEGQFQPEILAEAKMGHIDEEMVHDKVRQQIFALLDGKAPSRDPQGEAYRLLVVAACNFWNKAMPFLFQRIDDYTELLMPDDLLSGNSILAYTREAMTPDACEDVEVIGWLYQFYISEKKDEVFDGLNKNKKITPENIPAATQLFTPHWIVRYLVENSLGRLWMLNRPGSKLVERMDYYIKPEEPETDFLRISSPEEIKICDPACGSGHMLTYAFDLLYAIYEEEGYEPAEIPEKILTNNLFGIEIDERAGELAAFALTMKARAKQRRFFNKGVKPNICVLENVHFDGNELKDYMDFVGRDLFTAPLQTTLRQFEEADNFGSLIRPDVTDVDGMLRILESKNVSGQLFISMAHQKVLQALRQADYLSPKYHVVIANPPYMGGKGMNGRMGAWAKDNYPNSKSDLFGMFIERNLDLAQKRGTIAMITMQSWMFLLSFEALRVEVLDQNTLLSMAHLGARAFDSIGGEVVSTTAFVAINSMVEDFDGSYVRLVDGKSEAEKREALLQAARNPDCGWSFKTSAKTFQKIPSSPVAYWVSEGMADCYVRGEPLSTVAPAKLGMRTGNNSKWLRLCHEISYDLVNVSATSSEDAKESRKKWFPYNKGGEFRRWYGNNEYMVFWENDGHEIKCETLEKYPQLSWDNLGWKITNEADFFKPSLTWSFVSSSSFGVRSSLGGALFDVGGSSAFPKPNQYWVIAGFLCSRLSFEFLKLSNPTLNFQVANINSLPWCGAGGRESELNIVVKRLVDIGRSDWDSYEISWDFTILPLLNPDYRQPTLKATYQKLRAHWRDMTLEMQRLEEENNRIFIDAYGLQDELTPEVPLNEITLTCNPHYRYGNDKSEDELEALLLADTMRELVSYAVGCMFGRYALDKPGLILANQGETLADFVRKVCSEEWVVDSEGENNGDRSQLQRVNSLAEGDGLGGTGLSGHQAVPEGGTLRVNQSSQAVSGFHSIEHSGRSGQKIDGGVSEFLVHCERFKSRDGDPNPACPALELCNDRYSATNSQSVRGSEPPAERADEQPEVTTHCPLSTIHFLPDDDNVIPMLDGDWFTDDIAERFREFLRVAFGEEHYEENLRFVEQALNIKGKRNYSIRDYFLREFYTDHVKRYKKRPIYWLFSSPKGSFNALIYMHRYRPDTVSVVLNDYLREFRTKLASHKNHLEAVSISGSASQGEKTKALKEIEKITKMIAEMEDYEREVLYPLATEQVEIDLDDGVKVNYPKFGAALKKIVGLDAKDD
jgi:type II restriction/modification system DNA methylase subunit YeeA